MEYKIKELMNVNRGASPRPIIDFLTDKGYKWLKISDFNMFDRYVYNTKEHIIEEGVKKTRYLPKGTLILTNSATPGIPIFLGDDMCLHDGFLYFQNIDEDKISIQYLYYWFLFNRSKIVSQANGSVFQNLKKEIVENFIIDIPTINKQIKIVEILENINNKIELNNQINDNLHKLSDELYKGWFIDYNYPNSNGKLKESSLGLIPEDWRVERLDNVADCQNGYAFYKDGYDEDGIMVIDLGNINLNSTFIYTNADKYIMPDRVDTDKFNKYKVYKNDLIMVMTDRKATMELLGKTGKIFEDKEFLLNQRMYRIIHEEGENKLEDITKIFQRKIEL